MADVRKPKFDLKYVEDARRPLHSLVFLLPLILAYEVAAILIDPSEDRVIAHHMMKTLGVMAWLPLRLSEMSRA